ncbi:MAG: YggS family pyridoxal phosphate-dependent enzyme [Clostridia bacterium]|nr:YggS family pyridoxal phosphate-dependent enzyme [Clostridia bacterium]
MGIRENLASVQARICQALAKSGRQDQRVTLVAVSKYSTAEEVLEAASCGQRVFAENRVQSLLEKWKALEEYREQGVAVPDLTWHLIGHLQTNKVKYIVGKVDLIHSVDSIRLVEEINRVSAKKGVITNILLEVNVSGEESKSGISPEEIDSFVDAMGRFENVCLQGLMTMAPKGAEEKELREIFSRLYEKFIDKKCTMVHNVVMTYLSMGMSADFDVAIEEGANMIRVGHGIFL